MNRKIKLLWHFRGEDAKETAKHHTVHLKEFSVLEKLPFHEINIEEKNPMFFSAYITINEENLHQFKNVLKPHQGIIV